MKEWKMANKKFTAERVRALADKIPVNVTGGRHGRAHETKVILPEIELFDRMEICQALFEYADTLDRFKTAKDWIRSGKVAKAAEHGDKQAQKETNPLDRCKAEVIRLMDAVLNFDCGGIDDASRNIIKENMRSTYLGLSATLKYIEYAKDKGDR